MAKENKTLVVKIDEELHKQLKLYCVEHGTTIKELITEFIKEKTDKKKGE